MNFPDRMALEVRRLVAEKLVTDPDSTIRAAKDNITRWIRIGSSPGSFKEWIEILNTFTIERIRQIILAEDDRGQDLRAKSPFVGVISDSERRSCLDLCTALGLE
jgi:hypothetical protein